MKAITILDLFFLYCSIERSYLSQFDLHLIGLTVLHIAIKVEERSLIPLERLLNDVGKNLFFSNEVLAKEKEILQTIRFQIHYQDLFDKSY